MTRRARPTHPFQPDPGVTTWDGKAVCGRDGCGLTEDKVVHRMPAVADEVRDAEQRRLGERGE